MVTMGAYTAMPIVVCWFNLNLGGHHRRAVGSGWQIGVSRESVHGANKLN